MAREPRAPRPKLDQPGQRPLLQGHLRPGGVRAGETAPTETDEVAASPAAGSADAAAEPTAAATAQPATEVAQGEADVVRGKATKSPANVATRPHLEGPEQGAK